MFDVESGSSAVESRTRNRESPGLNYFAFAAVPKLGYFSKTKFAVLHLFSVSSQWWRHRPFSLPSASVRVLRPTLCRRCRRA